MALATFLKTIWEARILANFHNTSLAYFLSTKPTKIEGKTVKFGNVGSVAVNDYDGEVLYADIEVPEVDLNLDQKKYFAFKVDDVDRVQAAGELVDAHTQEASATMQEVVDTYTFATLATAAGKKLGTKEAHSKNAYNLIVDMGTELSKKKVPKTDRYCVINADYLGLLSKDVRFTSNPVVLENGVVEGQKINGLQICVSEELPVTAGRTTIIALHRLGLGFAMQLEEVEALRLQTTFADAVRGLNVFGATSLKKDAVVTMSVSIVDAPVETILIGNTEAAPVNTKEVSGE